MAQTGVEAELPEHEDGGAIGEGALREFVGCARVPCRHHRRLLQAAGVAAPKLGPAFGFAPNRMGLFLSSATFGLIFGAPPAASSPTAGAAAPACRWRLSPSACSRSPPPGRHLRASGADALPDRRRCRSTSSIR